MVAMMIKVIVVIMDANMDVVYDATFSNNGNMDIDTQRGLTEYVGATKSLARLPMKYSGYADVKVQHMAPNSNVVVREVVYSYSLSYTMDRGTIRPL